MNKVNLNQSILRTELYGEGTGMYILPWAYQARMKLNTILKIDYPKSHIIFQYSWRLHCETTSLTVIQYSNQIHLYGIAKIEHIKLPHELLNGARRNIIGSEVRLTGYSNRV